MPNNNKPTQQEGEPNIITVYRKDLKKFCEKVPTEGVVYSMFRNLQKPFHHFEKAIFQDDNGDCKVLFDRYN